MTDLIIRNARITTLHPAQPAATALAVADGIIVAIGDEAEVMATPTPRRASSMQADAD